MAQVTATRTSVGNSVISCRYDLVQVSGDRSNELSGETPARCLLRYKPALRGEPQSLLNQQSVKSLRTPQRSGSWWLVDRGVEYHV